MYTHERFKICQNADAVVVAVIVAAFAVDIVVGQILLVICRLLVYLPF